MSDGVEHTLVSDSSDFRTIDFETSLREVQTPEAKYSRGFLAADLSRFFSGLADHWKPFFGTVGASLRLVDIKRALFFPQELARIVVLEVNGESAVIGLDEVSQEVLVSVLVPETSQSASEVVVEYLERRLLTTLTKCWTGPDPLLCYYLSSDWADEVEILGGIELQVEIGGRGASFWFGVGPRMLDEIDRLWKRQRTQEVPAKLTDSVSTLTVEIAQLAVPPAMLIDYLRAGTIVDLEIPKDELVTISVNNHPWARGRLVRFNRTFAVEVVDLEPLPFPPSQGRTRVLVEVGRTGVDEHTLLEYQQAGAIIPIGKPLGGMVSLVINAEHVANAILGEANGRLAIQVVPKE